MKIIIIFTILFTLLVAMITLSCSAEEEVISPTSTTPAQKQVIPPTSTTSTSSNTQNEYPLAIAKIQDSTSLQITNYATGKKSAFIRNNPNFTKILQLFSASTLIQTTNKAKTIIENGKAKTVEVGIPYPMGYIATFYLNDGSKLNFDVIPNNIWFETDNAICKASVSLELHSLIKDCFTNYPLTP